MSEEYKKRLDEWALVKARLENRNHKPPFFKEGKIWWCHIGENLGVETSGKHEEFTRPVFIFKKYDRYSFLGFPLTTKQKIGSWYVPIGFNGLSQTIIVSQGKSMDYRRLKERIGELDSDEQAGVTGAYRKLHIKIDPPQSPAEVVGKSQIQANDSTVEDAVKSSKNDLPGFSGESPSPCGTVHPL